MPATCVFSSYYLYIATIELLNQFEDETDEDDNDNILLVLMFYVNNSINVGSCSAMQ